MKKNIKRFPRAKLRKAGGVLETADVLSIFHEAPKADARAFSQLMKHLKEFDAAPRLGRELAITIYKLNEAMRRP